MSRCGARSARRPRNAGCAASPGAGPARSHTASDRRRSGATRAIGCALLHAAARRGALHACTLMRPAAGRAPSESRKTDAACAKGDGMKTVQPGVSRKERWHFETREPVGSAAGRARDADSEPGGLKRAGPPSGGPVRSIRRHVLPGFGRRTVSATCPQRR